MKFDKIIKFFIPNKHFLLQGNFLDHLSMLMAALVHSLNIKLKKK